MESLRWILLALGIAVLIGIYVTGRRRSRSRADQDLAEAAKTAEPTDERSVIADESVDPGLEAEMRELGRAIRPAEEETEAPVDTTSSPAEPAAPAKEQESVAAAEQPVDKVIAIFLKAPADEPFSGSDLLQAFEEVGLEFGEMNVFHFSSRSKDASGALFSVANMVEPGWFDPDKMDDFQSPGLALFLRLPGPSDAVGALDAMFDTAEQLRQRLGGELRDSSRSVLSRQTMGHLREQVQEYSRRRRTAAP